MPKTKQQVRLHILAIDDQGMGLGADHYFTKPFRPRELLRALEVRLQRLEGLRAAGETLVWDFRKAATAST